ncbi:lantibiotic dehydratase C-terminal domain-containing protein [Nonomuraea sp. LPB2021202275-12-8]|uniref:lantibiotic dehydratase C-terminal domain-containing protein n=1 Tax=Nonomuraea sp. LPB2021202275-12-8 TaxID=3120159 RepID=UPI00300CD2DF
MTGTRSWISVHVFYDGDLDLVITDLLATVQDRLDHVADGAGLFFLRYWEGGPHLRIRALAAPGRTDDVRRIVSGAVADFLSRLPAPTRGTQADYDLYAPSMAALEQMPSYERHRRPNNSFAFIPYRPETRKYGTGASLHAAEDHFVRCSAAVRRLLATEPSGNRRSTAAFTALALNRWIASRGARWPEPETPPWPPGGEAEAQYERRRHTLLAIAERTRALAANPPGEPSGFAGALAASATALAGRIGEPHAVRDVLDVCAHLTCNRLGVSLTEESCLRDLAGRTFAELARETVA